MQVDAFILSDAAAVAEGKLYVHGGGVTRINAPALPVTVPLTLTARLLVSEDDIREDHRMEFSVRTPSGVDLTHGLTIETPGGPAPEVLEGEERFLQVVINRVLRFAEEGVHRFTFSVDGEMLRELTLPVVLIQAEPVTPAPTPLNRAERRRQQRGRR